MDTFVTAQVHCYDSPRRGRVWDISFAFPNGREIEHKVCHSRADAEAYLCERTAWHNERGRDVRAA